ncbi:MAG TPA: hypothetical protein VFX30_10675 [bacterium]|nr:hypothetical protein [bacterium]
MALSIPPNFAPLAQLPSSSVDNPFSRLSLPVAAGPACTALGLSRREGLEAFLGLEVGARPEWTESRWIERMGNVFGFEPFAVTILRDFQKGILPPPELQAAIYGVLIAAEAGDWNAEPAEGRFSSLRLLFADRDRDVVLSRLVANQCTESAQWFCEWKEYKALPKTPALLRELVEGFRRNFPLSGISRHLETQIEPTRGCWPESEMHGHLYEVSPLIELLGGEPPHIEHCELDALRLSRWLLAEGYSNVEILEIRAEEGLLTHRNSIWSPDPFRDPVPREDHHCAVTFDGHVVDLHSLSNYQPLTREDYFNAHFSQKIVTRRYAPNDYRALLKAGGQYAEYAHDDFAALPELKDDPNAGPVGPPDAEVSFVPVHFHSRSSDHFPLFVFGTVHELARSLEQYASGDQEEALAIVREALGKQEPTDIRWFSEISNQRAAAKALWAAHIEGRESFERWKSFVSRRREIRKLLAESAAILRQRTLWNLYEEGNLRDQIEALEQLKYFYARYLSSGGVSGAEMLAAVRSLHAASLRPVHYPGLLVRESGHTVLNLPPEFPKPAYLDLPDGVLNPLADVLFLSPYFEPYMGFQAYFRLGGMQTFQDIVTDVGLLRYEKELSQKGRFEKPMKVKRSSLKGVHWWLDDGYHRTTVVSRRPLKDGFRRFLWGEFAGNQSLPVLDRIPLEEIRVVSQEEYAQRAKDNRPIPWMDLEDDEP